MTFVGTLMHFKYVCRLCMTVTSQCRCPAEKKPVYFTVCEGCRDWRAGLLTLPTTGAVIEPTEPVEPEPTVYQQARCLAQGAVPLFHDQYVTDAERENYLTGLLVGFAQRFKNIP